MANSFDELTTLAPEPVAQSPSFDELTTLAPEAPEPVTPEPAAPSFDELTTLAPEPAPPPAAAPSFEELTTIEDVPPPPTPERDAVRAELGLSFDDPTKPSPLRKKELPTGAGFVAKEAGKEAFRRAVVRPATAIAKGGAGIIDSIAGSLQATGEAMKRPLFEGTPLPGKRADLLKLTPLGLTYSVASLASKVIPGMPSPEEMLTVSGKGLGTYVDESRKLLEQVQPSKPMFVVDKDGKFKVDWKAAADPQTHIDTVLETLVGMSVAIAAGGGTGVGKKALLEKTFRSSMAGTMLEAGPMYRDLRKQGMDSDEAAVRSVAFGTLVYNLEKIGFDKMFGGKGIKSALISTLAEAGTEFLEEPFGAIIENLGRKGITVKKLGREVLEASWEGLNVLLPSAITGGVIGGADTSTSMQEIADFLRESGDTDQAVGVEATGALPTEQVPDAALEDVTARETAAEEVEAAQPRAPEAPETEAQRILRGGAERATSEVVLQRAGEIGAELANPAQQTTENDRAGQPAVTPEEAQAIGEVQYAEENRQDLGDTAIELEQSRRNIDSGEAKIVEGDGSEPSAKEQNLRDTAFRNSRLDAARSLANLPEIPKAESESFKGAAESAIAKGMVDQADSIASEINADKTRVASVEETIAMEVRLEELENKDRALATEQMELIQQGKSAEARSLADQRQDTLQLIDRLTEAGRSAGTRAGRMLAIRRFQIAKEKLRIDNIRQEATLAKGEALTPEEADRLDQIIDELQEASIEVDKRTVEADKAIKQANMDSAAKNIKKELASIRRRRSKESTKAERDSIKAELSKLGLRVNDIFGAAKQGVDVHFLLGRLARTYIEDGVTTLKELQDRMIADVPQLDVHDVNEVLANRSTGQLKKAESRTQKTLRELRKQARLTVQINDAINGVFAKPKPKAQASAEVKRLRRQLNELRLSATKTTRDDSRLRRILAKLDRVNEQLDGHFRDIKQKKPRPADPARIQAAQKALSEAESFMRATDNISILEEQLRTGNFDVAPARTAAIKSERLEQAQVKVRQLRSKVRQEIEVLKPRTKRQVAYDTASAIGTGWRALEATGEMSGMGRQGMLLINHQMFSGRQGLKNIGNAFVHSMKATFSQNTSDAIQMAIENDPFQYDRAKHELELTSVEGGVSQREETFINNFLERIPGIGHVIKASNRNMVTFLNLMRVAAYDSVVKANPQWTDAQKTVWAKTINAMSGRSSLPKYFTGKGSKALAILGFAPNFAASRIEAPARLLLTNMVVPGVRKESVKTTAGFLTMQATFYALAALAGGEVGTDPEEFDYGRVTFGNTKIDLMAGLDKPLRLLLLGGLKFFDLIGLRKATKKIDVTKSFFDYLKYKQSPLIGTPGRVLYGKDLFGQDVPRLELAMRSILPLFYQDVYEAAGLNPKEMKKRATLSTTALGLFGAGNVTIPNELLRPKIRKIYKSRGIANIGTPGWPEWFKERKYIRPRDALENTFNSVMAQWLQENEGMLDRLDKDAAKDRIQSKASELREVMKDRLEEPADLPREPRKRKQASRKRRRRRRRR